MLIRKHFLAAILCIVIGMVVVQRGLLFQENETAEELPDIVIGLVLTDCEDDWRQAMYDSIQSEAKKRHIQVTTMPSARTQADQIDAIRSLLVYRADVIIFSPVMENGWENILSEAAEANIPLIIINEQFSTTNNGEGLGAQTYHVGFDYYQLAQQLANSFVDGGGSEFQVVQLGGTIASSVSNGISLGLWDVMTEKQGPYQLKFSVGCDYMRSRAYEAVTGLLRNQYQFDTVFSYSDGMTLGVISALEDQGLIPGEDVRIFSVGGGPTVTEAFHQGKISALANCDLTEFGEAVIDTVAQLHQKEEPNKNTTLPGMLLVNGGSEDR